MKVLKDYFDESMYNWLHGNGLKYKMVAVASEKGELNIIYNDKFSLKIYDRMGHGFGVTVNVAIKYDESMYQSDNFSISWVYKYLELVQTASFDGRELNQYEHNLPKLLTDIKAVIPRLNEMSESEWANMQEWITIETKKRFT